MVINSDNCGGSDDLDDSEAENNAEADCSSSEDLSTDEVFSYFPDRNIDDDSKYLRLDSDDEVKSPHVINLDDDNHSADAQGRKIIDLDNGLKRIQKDDQDRIRREQSAKRVEKAKEAIERTRKNLEE